MIREKLIDKKIGDYKKFRWRSHEVSRIEGLSDAVFGFAVTLLVVSLEVPRTFAELMQTMRGFGAFAISFTLLLLVWYNQYKFFRRYGLQDALTVCLNCFLLFVVLFYVYPLKFLFTFLMSVFTGGGGRIRLPSGLEGVMVDSNEQVSTLMIIFGAGYVAIFSVFVLLYWHAYRKRHELDLNALEIFDTRVDIQESFLNVGIGSLSIAVAAVAGGRYPFPAGMVYMLNGVLSPVHGMMMGKRRRKLEEQASSSQKPGTALE
jgi:hypothetical protein